MKFFLVAAFVAVMAIEALAEAPVYGPPRVSSPAPSYGVPQEEAYVPQVYRHVYVHTAPDEPNEVQSRVIRVPGGDRHVNIIFVKTPSQSSRQETEVILPDQDEHKNLVYVLLKKGENTNDVKIRRPAAPVQQKPEVYFIRYKDEQQGGYQQSPPPQAPSPVRSSYAAPSPVRTPSSSYGTPF